MDFGRLRQISSREESCRTTNDAMFISFAILRRHSRKYSFRSSSTAPAARASTVCGPRRVLTADAALGAGAAFTNHAAVLPHTSHAAQVSHLGISPKCAQIC